MWMITYIREIKRQFRDVYKFTPLPGSTEDEPLVEVPDGEYLMTIEGKVDHVRIVGGNIHCCNFDEKGINLDKLQRETEKLLALLKDRQPGLMTWNDFLRDRLTNLHKLTSQALGK